MTTARTRYPSSLIFYINRCLSPSSSSLPFFHLPSLTSTPTTKTQFNSYPSKPPKQSYRQLQPPQWTLSSTSAPLLTMSLSALLTCPSRNAGNTVSDYANSASETVQGKGAEASKEANKSKPMDILLLTMLALTLPDRHSKERRGIPW